MILFHNDYSEGCHPAVLQHLVETNMEQTDGYGEDRYCRRAAERIRALCGDENAAVHFLVGGTQANLTVIAAALRPHQGVIGADSAHINVHETGAIEATGHKVLWLPSQEGKIKASQVEKMVQDHRTDSSFEHMVQPKMVYISSPTEWGTLYSKQELEELSAVCRKLGLYLFLDGARLGYGLTAPGADVTMEDLYRMTDVFYIGGTKVGALFGEAVVISNPALQEDFRYLIKQRGAMLAKGRLLGVQFDALFDNDLYFEISRHANVQAQRLAEAFRAMGCDFFMPHESNQLFPILPGKLRQELGKTYTFIEMDWVDDDRRVCRFCTSWATLAENVDKLCADLQKYGPVCHC